MCGKTRARALRAGLAVGLAALAALLAGAAGAQSIYDFTTRTPSVDAFGYRDTAAQQVPNAPTTPTTVFDATRYGQASAHDGVMAEHSVESNARYGQMRFVFRLDEPSASVASLELRWVGASVNAHAPRTDGAAVYVWNWASGDYDAVGTSGDSEAVVTIDAVISTDAWRYVGGTGDDAVVILVVTHDVRTGNRDLTLSTDYVRLTVTGGGISHFEVDHDGAGIHCLPEAVSVRAVAAGGATATGYQGTIVLDTQTGRGSWLPGPGLGGVLDDGTPDDGVATYGFASADEGVASFLLWYPDGPAEVPVGVLEAGNPGVSDDGSHGLLAFAPSGFTVTASALPNPPPDPITDAIGPQTAGMPFAAHLTAYGQTPTDPTCGVIESYAGVQNLLFWSTWLDPAVGALGVSVDGAAIGTSEASAVPVPVGFTSGQAAVEVRYKDVGRIRVAVRDPAPAEPPGGTTGSTGDFVVRPADLAIVEIGPLDGTPTRGGAAPDAPIFVAAGAPFRAVVRALDAEGDATPSYGREAAPEGIVVRSAALVAPAGGANGSGGDGAIAGGSDFAAIAPAGSFEAMALGFDEVGAIRLRAGVADGSYLGTGDVVGSESGTVGRFSPDHFDVELAEPMLETSCTAGGFGYVGQPIEWVVGSEPRLIASAKSALGTPTANYTGAWLRLDAGTLAGIALSDASGTLTPAAPELPSIGDLGAGRVAIAFDTGPPLAFARGAPGAPFEAEVSLALEVRDADGVVYPGNPVRFGDVLPGTGIAWSAGGGQRFGRLEFENAFGSELVDLPVPLRTRFFDGTSFVVHTDDGCTTVGLAELSATKSPPALSTTPSIANTPLAGGDAGLALSAPGAGHTGHVDLSVDLAEQPWLRGDWDGDGSFGEDPSGRATFGIHAGRDALIYVRERY